MNKKHDYRMIMDFLEQRNAEGAKNAIRDNRVMLPFSVQIHHSFVDGVHIGKLANVLQNYLDNFE